MGKVVGLVTVIAHLMLIAVVAGVVTLGQPSQDRPQHEPSDGRTVVFDPDAQEGSDG